MELSSVRVDVWTWSVRLYKTRSAASTACKAGHIRLNGKKAKPSQAVKIGDRIEALTGDRERILVVTKLLTKRVGAPLAVTCFDDHTPALPPKAERPSVPTRDRGAGRPTKRDRRLIERLRGH